MKTEWQPMETAPKDGSSFLMYITGMDYSRDNNNQKYKAQRINSIVIADYDLNHNCFYGAITGHYHYCFQIEQVNFEEKHKFLGHDSMIHIKATHWMPLPQPPIINMS